MKMHLRPEREDSLRNKSKETKYVNILSKCKCPVLTLQRLNFFYCFPVQMSNVLLNKIYLLKKNNDLRRLVCGEIDQNKVSLWLKQEQISAEGVRKSI